MSSSSSTKKRKRLQIGEDTETVFTVDMNVANLKERTKCQISCTKVSRHDFHKKNYISPRLVMSYTKI